MLVDLGRFSLVDDNLWLIVKLWFIKPDDYGLLLYSSLMRDALQKDTKTDFGFTPTSTPTHLSLNHIGATSHFISFCDAYPCTLIRKPVKAFLPIVPVLVRFRIFQKSKNNISILWKIWRNMLKWGENVRQFSKEKNSKPGYIQIHIIHMLIIIGLSELWRTCFMNQDHRLIF